MLELTRRLHDAGVLLTVGTDGANPWVFHHEMELLVAAGIPPVEVVRMATRNAAISLGRIGEFGTVEAGKRAELVILSADPTRDIRNSRRIESVVKDGVIRKPAEFLPARLKSRRGGLPGRP
jgi:imidazolonepropionase-like amidohydrolase